MSHSIQSVNSHPIIIETQVTIIDYSTGGEAITAIEFGLPTVDTVVFSTVRPDQNSLGATLIPVVINGKIVLAQVSGGVIAQIPPTIGLNAIVRALITSRSLSSKIQ